MGYFDLDAAGCKEATASGVVEVLESELRGVTGKQEDVTLVRFARGKIGHRAVVVRKYSF